ncbi:MAG: hypothetical protein GX605_08280 [Chloroflexi bacterium]|nr:hypothetical protein [Chloroflexota bacterium]
MTGEPVSVACYSGHRYAQEPRSFVWQGQEHTVRAVVQAWREPAGPVFVVEDACGRRWRLRYGEAQDVWRLEPACTP